MLSCGKGDFPVDDTIKAMAAVPPFGLGFPSDNAVSVSNYYLGARMSQEQIARVTKAVCSTGVEPENTYRPFISTDVKQALSHSRHSYC